MSDGVKSGVSWQLRVKQGLMGTIILASILSAVTFVWKLYTFFDDWTSQAGIHFAGPHLVTYSLVALGFVFFLLIAFLKGHFSDIEAPKTEMLEREMEYDREGHLC